MTVPLKSLVNQDFPGLMALVIQRDKLPGGGRGGGGSCNGPAVHGPRLTAGEFPPGFCLFCLTNTRVKKTLEAYFDDPIDGQCVCHSQVLLLPWRPT